MVDFIRIEMMEPNAGVGCGVKMYKLKHCGLWSVLGSVFFSFFLFYLFAVSSASQSVCFCIFSQSFFKCKTKEKEAVSVIKCWCGLHGSRCTNTV